MITPEQHVEMRRLYYAEHWTIGTIAAQLVTAGAASTATELRPLVASALRACPRCYKALPWLMLRPELEDSFAERITEQLTAPAND